jgi:hypothetical protein
VGSIRPEHTNFVTAQSSFSGGKRADFVSPLGVVERGVDLVRRAQEGRFEIDAAPLGEDDRRPDHVRVLMSEPLLDIVELADSLACLNELGQVAEIT